MILSQAANNNLNESIFKAISFSKYYTLNSFPCFLINENRNGQNGLIYKYFDGEKWNHYGETGLVDKSCGEILTSNRSLILYDNQPNVFYIRNEESHKICCAQINEKLKKWNIKKFDVGNSIKWIGAFLIEKTRYLSSSSSSDSTFSVSSVSSISSSSNSSISSSSSTQEMTTSSSSSSSSSSLHQYDCPPINYGIIESTFQVCYDPPEFSSSSSLSSISSSSSLSSSSSISSSSSNSSSSSSMSSSSSSSSSSESSSSSILTSEDYSSKNIFISTVDTEDILRIYKYNYHHIELISSIEVGSWAEIKTEICGNRISFLFGDNGTAKINFIDPFNKKWSNEIFKNIEEIDNYISFSICEKPSETNLSNAIISWSTEDSLNIMEYSSAMVESPFYSNYTFKRINKTAFSSSGKITNNTMGEICCIFDERENQAVVFTLGSQNSVHLISENSYTASPILLHGHPLTYCPSKIMLSRKDFFLDISFISDSKIYSFYVSSDYFYLNKTVPNEITILSSNKLKYGIVHPDDNIIDTFERETTWESRVGDILDEAKRKVIVFVDNEEELVSSSSENTESLDTSFEDSDNNICGMKLSQTGGAEGYYKEFIDYAFVHGDCYIEYKFKTYWIKDRLIIKMYDEFDSLLATEDTGCVATYNEYTRVPIGSGWKTGKINVPIGTIKVSVQIIPECDPQQRKGTAWIFIASCECGSSSSSSSSSSSNSSSSSTSSSSSSSVSISTSSSSSSSSSYDYCLDLGVVFPTIPTPLCEEQTYREYSWGPFKWDAKIQVSSETVMIDDYLEINGAISHPVMEYDTCGDIRISASSIIFHAEYIFKDQSTSTDIVIPAGTPITLKLYDTIGISTGATGSICAIPAV